MMRAARFHVLHLTDGQRDGADDAPAERNAGDGDGDDDRRQSGADRHGDRHGQDQVRKCLHDLHDSLAHEVEASAEVPASHAPQRAGRRAEQHGRERDEEGGARAVDHARQGVAAHLISSEVRLRVRRFVHPREIGLQRIPGRDPRRRQGDDDDGEPD